MADHNTAELTLLIPREQAENAFRDALALFVGRGRQFSVKQLAKGVGLYKDGEPHTKPLYDFLSYPSGHPDQRPLHMGLQFSITKFLGADFTNEWLRLSDQGAFDLPDDEPDPGNLAADAAEDSATIVRAAMDRQFDAQERAALSVVGQRKIMRGKQLVALGRTASKRRAVA